MTGIEYQIDSAAISDKGLNEKRPQNEDSFVELRDSRFYAVADGVGGAQAGDVASQMATEILGEAFINLREGGDAEARMRAAIEQANSAIFQMSNELHQLSTMATTIVGLYIGGDVATIAHVGDSRLYRIDAQGQIFQETQDHSVVEEEVRAGRMTPEQALNHPNRNVISRALGAEEMVEIDMKSILIEPGTSFLLCSDGVTRHIPDEELRIFVIGEKDPFAVCQKIKETCYSRGAEDNLTAVVVKIWTREDEDRFQGVEEDTLVTARPPLVNSDVLVAQSNLIPTTSDVSFDSQDYNDDKVFDEAFNLGQQPVSNRDSEHKGKEFKAAISKSKNPDRTPSPKSDDVRTIRIDEDKTGILGKVLKVLPWLLLVALLAAGGYYFWVSRGASSETTSNAPSDPLVNYENARRQADADPSAYVANAAPSAKTAGDYYLLARAYYLTGDYVSSKNQLTRAQEMPVSSVAAANQKVVTDDIEILALVLSYKSNLAQPAKEPTPIDENANVSEIPR